MFNDLINKYSQDHAQLELNQAELQRFQVWRDQNNDPKSCLVIDESKADSTASFTITVRTASEIEHPEPFKFHIDETIFDDDQLITQILEFLIVKSNEKIAIQQTELENLKTQIKTAE